jgi:hypothetical protein
MLRDARSALLSMRQRWSHGETGRLAIGGFASPNPRSDLRANASKQKWRVKAPFFPASKVQFIHRGIQFAAVSSCRPTAFHACRSREPRLGPDRL